MHGIMKRGIRLNKQVLIDIMIVIVFLSLSLFRFVFISIFMPIFSYILNCIKKQEVTNTIYNTKIDSTSALKHMTMAKYNVRTVRVLVVSFFSFHM